MMPCGFEVVYVSIVGVCLCPLAFCMVVLSTPMILTSVYGFNFCGMFWWYKNPILVLEMSAFFNILVGVFLVFCHFIEFRGYVFSNEFF